MAYDSPGGFTPSEVQTIDMMIGDLWKRLQSGEVSFHEAVAALMPLVMPMNKSGKLDNANNHIINFDLKPSIPSGSEIVTIDQPDVRIRGKWKFDPKALELVKFEAHPHLSVNGTLGDRLLIGAQLLDFLLNNPDLMPEEWKSRKEIIFGGTIYRRHGGYHVRQINIDYTKKSGVTFSGVTLLHSQEILVSRVYSNYSMVVLRSSPHAPAIVGVEERILPVSKDEITLDEFISMPSENFPKKPQKPGRLY